MLNINIETDAKEYLLSKGGAVTVQAMVMSGCHGVTREPLLFAETPEDIADYDLVVVDGVKVYVAKDPVIEPTGAKIYLVGDTAYKGLEVSGLRYRM
ncbi:MAG: hypothetical protein GX325_07305 [Peptococcaceae bacterium]|nr:hypothetical protein [Peptococcaceae bacterium]